MIEEEDNTNVNPLLSIVRRPSALLKALQPIENRLSPDKFVRVKEQWLLEKFLMQKEIEKNNKKQKIINKVLSVQKNMETDESVKGQYSYFNKTSYRYKKFNKKLTS